MYGFDVSVLREILFAIGVGSWVVFGACLVGTSFYGARALWHRKPDAPYRRIVAILPRMAGWFADQLTERGLLYRRRSLTFMKVGLAAGATFALAVWLAAT